MQAGGIDQIAGGHGTTLDFDDLMGPSHLSLHRLISSDMRHRRIHVHRRRSRIAFRGAVRP